MEQKVADAAQGLADALKSSAASTVKAAEEKEKEVQAERVEMYKAFQAAVKERRAKFPHRFNDADLDSVVIDNTSKNYLHFAVEGDDYILKPGSNEVVSYSFDIAPTRVAEIAAAQLGPVIVAKVKLGKATLDRQKLAELEAANAKKVAEERTALEGRLKEGATKTRREMATAALPTPTPRRITGEDIASAAKGASAPAGKKRGKGK